MFEITLSNGLAYKVNNQELGKSMKAYVNADKQERQGQWLKAEAIAKIVADELWKKDGDFTKIENLYDLLELQAGQVRKYGRVCAFKAANKNLKGFETLSINAVDALAGIDKLDKFLKWLDSKKGISSLENLSERKILELKKEFQAKTNKNKKEKQAEKQSSTAENTAETVENKEIEYIIISYQGKNYKLDKQIFLTLEEVK